MKKKLVSLLLVSAMAFGTLAGCGNSNDSKKADTKDAGESKDGETKDVSLTVWSPQEDQDTGWLKQQCEAFNEAHPEWKLPMDFTVPPAPDAALYTEDSYEDETISVKLEHQEMDDGTKMHVAYIRIADPSQLRTGVANPEKPASTRTKTVRSMARNYNAVIALNGDNYTDTPKKTTFEYRMTTKIRSNSNKLKDILIIDDLGDFHLFVQSQGIKEYPEIMKKEGRKLINAFTFGPALVKDGKLLELDEDYGYNPNGREPRTAIGQMGPLSYVMVLIEAKDRSGKTGFSQGKHAEFMYNLGCVQAFNLDGGNSAEMVFGEQVIKGQPGGDERTLSDIIYFATMQP